MADASALPTDDDLQPAQAGASLPSPMAEGEAPGEPAALAEPGAPQFTPPDPAPAPGLASPEPSEPQANPAKPDPDVPANPDPDVASEGLSKPPEPSPEPSSEPTPDPTPDSTPHPVQAGPGAESPGANWAAAIASEPGAASPQPAPLPEPEVLAINPPPVPTPLPVPTLPPVPTVATTIDLPAREAGAGPSGEAGEGGEWALLLSKLQAWLGSGPLQDQLQAARTPFTLVAGLVALLVVLQLYGALLAVIHSFPLAPGLLELVGVIAVVRFGLDKLVRSQERRALIEGLQRRWQAFQGKA